MSEEQKKDALLRKHKAERRWAATQETLKNIRCQLLGLAEAIRDHLQDRGQLKPESNGRGFVSMQRGRPHKLPSIDALTQALSDYESACHERGEATRAVERLDL